MRLVQADPDDAIALLDPVRRRPGLAGNSLTGIERRDANTRAIRRVGPAVVGADQIPVLDPSQGERCPAVDAQIFEGDDPILYPEDDDLLVEQARSERLVTELTAGRHRMPVVSQDRVRHSSPPGSECRRSVYSMTGGRALVMVSLACYAPIVVSWDSRRRRRGVSEFGEAASEPRFLFFHDEYHLFSRAGAEL